MPLPRTIVFIGGCFFFVLLISVGYFGRLSSSPALIGLDLNTVEESSWNSGHDLLDDVFNATLGVRNLGLLQKYSSTDKAQFEKIFGLNLPERTDHRDALILASALSDMNVDFIDGVHEVSEKALPPGSHDGLSSSQFGAWRAHMNAISTYEYVIVVGIIIFLTK